MTYHTFCGHVAKSKKSNVGAHRITTEGSTKQKERIIACISFDNGNSEQPSTQIIPTTEVTMISFLTSE